MIIGITESTVDNSISNSEFEIHVTTFSDVIGTELREQLYVILGRICVSN